MSADIEELVSVIARNYGVWLIIAHQSLTQLDQRIQNVLMQMGTQIIGFTPNPDDALYLARQLVPYNPKWVKKSEPVWMNLEQMSEYGYTLDYSRPEIIDYRDVEYTPEEQQLLAAQQFQTLGRFRFIVRLPKGEGNISNKLQMMSIENLDPNFYPDERLLVPARRQLAAIGGFPIAKVLTDIQNRQNRERLENPAQPAPQLAILKDEEENTYEARNHLPETAKPSVSTGDSDRPEQPVSRSTRAKDDYWE